MSADDHAAGTARAAELDKVYKEIRVRHGSGEGNNSSTLQGQMYQSVIVVAAAILLIMVIMFIIDRRCKKPESFCGDVTGVVGGVLGGVIDSSSGGSVGIGTEFAREEPTREWAPYTGTIPYGTWGVVPWAERASPHDRPDILDWTRGLP